MLRWTAGGAVPSPTTLQLRVERRYPERIRAGAPVPTRSLSTEEVQANLRHFTVGMRGPRSRPCTALVLSGEGLALRQDLLPLLAASRQEGIRRVVLHLGTGGAASFEPGPWRGLVDELVLALGGEPGRIRATIAAAHEAGIAVSTSSSLDGPTLARIDEIVAALPELAPLRHSFTFPFPTDPDTVQAAPDPMEVARALDRVVPRLVDSGLQITVKGLPACYLGPARVGLGRTGNRWYVDADHQKEAALLFFPQVVAFHRGEACRFCAHAERCDGFFAEYLRRPEVPPLQPISESAG